MVVGTTKKELAEKLGVAKQTVVNYISNLGLEDHMTRVGKTDMLDDYAVSVLADALSKNVPPRDSGDGVGSDGSVIAALDARISDLKRENERLERQLEAREQDLSREREARLRETEKLHDQVADANARADRLAERLADIAERQQAIAAAHWWQRGRMASRLLGPGSKS